MPGPPQVCVLGKVDFSEACISVGVVMRVSRWGLGQGRVLTGDSLGLRFPQLSHKEPGCSWRPSSPEGQGGCLSGDLSQADFPFLPHSLPPGGRSPGCVGREGLGISEKPWTVPTSA